MNIQRSFIVWFCLAAPLAAADLKLGIVGTDVSHVIHFSRILNDASDPEHVEGARIVAAYKSSSPDIESSRSRVDGFARDLVEKYHVELVPDVASLCSKVDGVLIESGDGRAHLALVKQVLAAHKPMFIDKPLASTLKDAMEIARLAKEAGVPWFSSSSQRFGLIATTMKFPDITGAMVWGPGPVEEHHYLELAWYAIHPIETLYALMGPGCQEVSRFSSGDAQKGSDVIVGRWKDGRLGTVRTLRPSGTYGAVVFRAKGTVQSPEKQPLAYAALVKEFVKFFETGKPPVSNAETLEIYAFMDAAQRSKENGGKTTALRLGAE
jgi:hypothetical protein